MGDEELASGTSSAGHVLASLWLEPLVSQEVFLVPPSTPTYLLRLHIYIRAFVLHFNNGVVVLGCCCFPTTVAMLGPTHITIASLSRGESTPHIPTSVSALCKWH